jgi:hypothetical protein
MDYCGPRGIPHSVFLGWDASDRDKALTWQRRDHATCKRCGTRHEEWDPDDGGRENAYVAVPVQCPGCAERGRVESKVTEDAGPGVQVQLWTPEHVAASRAYEAAKRAAAEPEEAP